MRNLPQKQDLMLESLYFIDLFLLDALFVPDDRINMHIDHNTYISAKNRRFLH